MNSISSTLKQLLPTNRMAAQSTGRAYAPVNIALIKYWGKRDTHLNLPITDSLSISLRTLGSHSDISLCEGSDQIYLNGHQLDSQHAFSQRTSRYLDLFRPHKDSGFILQTRNDVPTAAGLASSASGYAALVLALDDLFQWQLDKQQLSILARIGSGSASRSLWNGLVHWHAGERSDGLDSYATPLTDTLPDLRIGLLTLSSQAKPTSSRLGMQQTVNGLSLYPAWPAMVKQHLQEIQAAIAAKDIARIGEISEHNALSMHATMLSASPALCYFLPETMASLHQLWQARAEGLACWATLDAGPNVKLIFSQENTAAVQSVFPEVQIITPFAAE